MSEPIDLVLGHRVSTTVLAPISPFGMGAMSTEAIVGARAGRRTSERNGVTPNIHRYFDNDFYVSLGAMNSLSDPAVRAYFARAGIVGLSGQAGANLLARGGFAVAGGVMKEPGGLGAMFMTSTSLLGAYKLSDKAMLEFGGALELGGTAGKWDGMIVGLSGVLGLSVTP